MEEDDDMLRPSLKSVLKSLAGLEKDEAVERAGWLLLSVEDDGELPLSPINLS